MSTICLNKRIRFGALLAVIASAFMAWINWMPTARNQSHTVTTLAQLPLSFEVNRGQAAADAKFAARGGGYALLLTDRGEPVLALRGRSGQTAETNAARAVQISEPDERTLLRLDFTGSNSAPQMQGEEPLPGRSNYLIGNDPSKWLIGVPHYARVRYRDVYPGVDVLYYGKDQQLEYDFIVRPGTEPDSIRMKVQGAEGIGRSEPGSLVLKTAAGDVLLHKPVAYQEGPGGETEVACNYFLDQGEVRFAVGDYDRGKVLRIDPVLSYAARLDASLRDIAVDGSGNTYVAGVTQSANFPTTPGDVQSTFGGVGDALIAKLDPTGSSLLFATYIGGKDYDSASSIALDSSGNVIVVGSTSSSNFPVNGPFQSTLIGEQDAFLIKLNPTGTQLLYSTYLGGAGSEGAAGVALDANGRAVLAGFTNFSNLPTSTGALQVVYGGNRDAFVAKLDTTQSGAASLLFSTYLGGSGDDEASAIAVDAAGFAFVTGITSSTNFPTTNPFQAACASCGKDGDAFVSKLSPDGTALVYSTFLGGSGRDIGNGIAVDSTGNAYIAGETQSSNFPTTAEAFQTTHHWLVDGFVTKLNAAGLALVYSTFIGGTEYDTATGIALDASGNAVVSGYSYSADFPTVKPVQGFVGALCPDGWGGTYPCSDAFVTKIDISGSTLIFSTLLGADTDDSAAGVSIDAANSMYIVGTAGDAFPFTPGALHMSGTGFAAKISPVTGSQPTATSLSSSPNPSNQNQSVTFTATVAPRGATGQMSLRDGNRLIGFASVSASGMATFSTNSLSGGTHSIIAEYPGDANFAASTSAALAHGVNSISLTTTQTSATVARGGTTTFPLTVSQAGALSSAIALSCSGLPTGWSCEFNPATVPAGSGPTQVTLTLQAGNATKQNFPPAPIGGPKLPGEIWPGVLASLILGVHLCVRGRKLAYLRARVALRFAALLLLAAGCGSGSSETPPSKTPQPVTVNFTVSAISDSITTSMPFSITVR
jgi:Bacterial Ig-like domain (group 3)/Beta-propeller repeat